MDEEKINHYFASLVLSLASSVWYQLGKIPNPASGKIEKNIENAQATIEILRMIKEKTAGNLSVEEENLINHTISDLQLNYADEMNKENSSKTLH